LIVVEFYGARVHGSILRLCVSARELAGRATMRPQPIPQSINSLGKEKEQ
jgi:hypothetical protein